MLCIANNLLAFKIYSGFSPRPKLDPLNEHKTVKEREFGINFLNILCHHTMTNHRLCINALPLLLTVSAADVTCTWLTLGAKAPKPVYSPQKLCEYQRGEDVEAEAAI